VRWPPMKWSATAESLRNTAPEPSYDANIQEHPPPPGQNRQSWSNVVPVVSFSRFESVRPNWLLKFTGFAEQLVEFIWAGSA
jgi:hypothetical protein